MLLRFFLICYTHAGSLQNPLCIIRKCTKFSYDLLVKFGKLCIVFDRILTLSLASITTRTDFLYLLVQVLLVISFFVKMIEMLLVSYVFHSLDYAVLLLIYFSDFYFYGLSGTLLTLTSDILYIKILI